MPFYRLRFETDAGNGQRLSGLLEQQGAMAVTLADRGEQPIFDEPHHATGTWTAVEVSALFDTAADIDGVLAWLQATLEGALPAHRIERVPDRDWERAWMERYRPLRICERLWICPSWTEPPDPEAVNLRLDPGMAFGTGTHATTALCLEWLCEQDLAGCEVIDYGCGSGILAIAALRLGARTAYAVDIDPQALAATAANARRNGVEHQLVVGAPASLPPQTRTPVVVANILAAALIELAPALAARVAPGGRLVLSGILAGQADPVQDSYGEQFNWTRRQRDNWVVLIGTRRP